MMYPIYDMDLVLRNDRRRRFVLRHCPYLYYLNFGWIYDEMSKHVRHVTQLEFDINHNNGQWRLVFMCGSVCLNPVSHPELFERLWLHVCRELHTHKEEERLCLSGCIRSTED